MYNFFNTNSNNSSKDSTTPSPYKAVVFLVFKSSYLKLLMFFKNSDVLNLSTKGLLGSSVSTSQPMGIDNDVIRKESSPFPLLVIVTLNDHEPPGSGLIEPPLTKAFMI